MNGKSIRTAKGAAGLPVGQMVQSDKGIILSLKAASHTSLTQLQSPRPKSEQLQTDSITSQQPSQDRLEPAQESGPALDSNSEVARLLPYSTPISPAPALIFARESPAPSYLNLA